MCMKNLRIIESDMMTNINNEYITEYIRGIIPVSDKIFHELEEYALENNVPIIEPEVAQFIRVIVKLTKPMKILEVGTAIGYSAIVFALAFPDSKITTIERNDVMISQAEKNIKRNNLENRIKLISGDAKDILPSLEGEYDLIFLDAAKGQYIDFFDEGSRLLKKGGIIISDNVLFKGMVAADELVVRRKKTIVKRLRTYLDYINNIEGYTSSVLPLGDGVAITYKD